MKARRATIGLLGACALAMGVLYPVGAGSEAAASPMTANSKIVTYAEFAGTVPNYIFPLASSAHDYVSNYGAFMTLMWLSLYTFGNSKTSSLKVNYKRSMAAPPVYSNHDKTITYHLKHYLWSTGTAVTARDLVFWMNLLVNNKTDYAGYVPGGWIDHVASFSAPSPRIFVLNLSKQYSHYYLEVNVELMPLPQQAWDKTSATSPVGNYDMKPAGAKAVRKFLNKEALSTATYATNPLWQVVDGPWRLKPKTGYQTTGQVILVANPRYSGPDKPKLQSFEELPFLSTSSEFSALKSGVVDYGYVPTTDLAQIPSLKAQGFTIRPWSQVGLNYVTFNFSNPKYGPLVNKLYVRQAMQSLIDQPAYIKGILRTYGIVENGPIPPFPQNNPFIAPSLRHKSPYPYSVARARHYLQSHGWSIPGHGPATCTRPGVGRRDCGKGIAAHTPLVLPLSYISGYPTVKEISEAMQSSFKAAGIYLKLKEGPSTTVVTATYDCQFKTMAKCPASSPTMSNYDGFDFGAAYMFMSGALFGCHADTNTSNFCTQRFQKIFEKARSTTTPKGSLQAIHAFDVLLAKQLPFLWVPFQPLQISAISSRLGGVTSQSPLAYLYPQTWYLK